MSEGWFSAPVPVNVGLFGSVRNIFNARDADEFIRERMPGSSMSIRAAHHACRAAMENPKKAESARTAFIEAARETHLLAI
jgi:hypothetical protein